MERLNIQPLFAPMKQQQPTAITTDNLMTVEQYAASDKNIAGKSVSVTSVYNWIEKKKVQTTKIGKITFVITN